MYQISLWCVSRYDQQPVHHWRCVGEAPNPATCHSNYGSVCESQRWQAAGWPRRQCWMTFPIRKLYRSVRTSNQRHTFELFFKALTWRMCLMHQKCSLCISPCNLPPNNKVMLVKALSQRNGCYFRRVQLWGQLCSIIVASKCIL